MMKYSARFHGLMGQAPERIPQWESLYCPEAISAITGIDYFSAPRSCMQRLAELYPHLPVGVPASDAPVARPEDSTGEPSDGHEHVRWGTGETWRFDWGAEFADIDDVLAYSPLEHLDLSDAPLTEPHDYSDEEKLYEEYRARLPDDGRGDTAPEGDTAMVGFYNTLIIWPIVTFGYEKFLTACLDPEFGRIMEEFARITDRVMRVFARLPVNFVTCHDDIVTTHGSLVPPSWLSTHIFPHYEKWWHMLNDAGKEVIFITDGCVDEYADTIISCGARGIITEPYTDFKTMARKHPDAFMAGEGDVRVLMRNDPGEIRQMVESMIETAQMCGGYFLKIGNLIPHNVPADALKYYLDLCEDLGWRR